MADDESGTEWTAVRVARPTAHYEAVVEFYTSVIGLPARGAFADHAGYDGTIFSLGAGVQLELTRHASGQPLPAPTDEDLLVLYFASIADRQRVEQRLADAGHEAIELANPFWQPDSVGYRDPDGWVVVLSLQGSPPD